MNFLPKDLITLAYLYIPYPKVIPFYQSLDLNEKQKYLFWDQKSEVDTPEVKRFTWSAQNPIIEYLRALALDNRVVRGRNYNDPEFPGSEIFIADAQMVRTAIKEKNYDLALYVVENFSTNNGYELAIITEDLCYTKWIGLLFILERRDLLHNFEIKSHQLAYRNPIRKVKKLHQKIYKKLENQTIIDRYNYQINFKLPVMAGSQPNLTSNMGIVELENLKYLAIRYNNLQMEKTLGGVEDSTKESKAYIFLSQDQKVLDILTANNDWNSRDIIPAITTIDNLNLFKGLLQSFPGRKEELLSSALEYAIYGSQIFNFIAQKYDIDDLVNLDTMITKTNLDFAGINYIFDIIRRRTRNALIMESEDAEEINHKVFNYLKAH